MSPSDNSEIRQQSTWRQAGDVKRRRHRRLFLKRLLFSMIFGAFVYGFFWLIVKPLKAPGTQLVLLTGAVSPDQDVSPTLPFVTADFESLESIAPFLRRTEPEDSRVYSPEPLKARTELQRIADQCDQRIDSKTDVVVMYIRAEGGVVDGEPVLSWQFDQHWSKDTTLPVSDLLQLLTRRPCATKLLILDCGSRAWDSGSGTLVNNFVATTERLVETHDDSTLWVMTSRADFESTYSSRTLGKTVFGKVFSEAFAGAADHDVDSSISMSELFRYVNQHTADWIGTRTARQLSQTPQLLHSESINWKNTPELLSLSRKYEPPEEPEPAAVLPAEDAADSDGDESLGGLGPDLFPAPRSRYRLAFISYAPQQDGQFAGPTSDSETVPPGDENVGGSPEGQSAAIQEDSESIDKADESDGADPAGSATESAFVSDVGISSWASLLDVWHKRDLLNAARPSPGDFAPHVWRLLEEEVLDRQSAILYGTESESESASFVLADQWSESQNLPMTTVETAGPMKQLARQWPQPSVDSNSISLTTSATGDAAKLLGEFRTLIDGDSIDDLKAWLAKQSQFHEIAELNFAAEVLSIPNLGWTTTRNLLGLRLKAEESAALVEQHRLQLQKRLERAERLRLEAERRILYRPAKRDVVDSKSLISRADDAYSQIRAAANLLEEAEQLSRRLLYEVPSRISDFRIQSESRVIAGLDFQLLLQHLNLLNDLQSIVYAADELSILRVADLNDVLVALKETQQRLQSAEIRAVQLVPKSGPVDAIQELRIEALGLSTLLTAESRNHLWIALENIVRQEGEMAKSSSQLLRDVTVSPNRWLIIQQHAELELLRCTLMVSRQSDPTIHTAQLQQAYQAALVKAEGTADSDALTRIWNTFAEVAAEMHRRLSNQLVESFNEARRETDPKALEGCLALEPVLFLLPSSRLRQLDLPVAVTLSNVRDRATAMDRNELQFQRTSLAMEDAPAEQLPYLKAVLSRLSYRSSDPPVIQLDVSSSLSIQSGETLNLPVQVVNLSDSEVAIQLTAEYDSSTLGIESGPGFPIFPAAQVRQATHQRAWEAQKSLRKLVRTAAFDRDQKPDVRAPSLEQLRALVQQGHYPIRASAVSNHSTATMKPGETRTIPLKVTCLKNSSGASRIILRFETETEYLRRDILTLVPAPLLAQPRFWGTPGTAGETEAGQRLSPFPNTTTNYQLALESVAQGASGVVVELLAAGKPVESPLPDYAVSLTQAADILATIQTSQVLAEAKDVKLLAGVDQAVTLTGVESAAPKSAAPKTEAQPTATESKSISSLQHGLILKLLDVDAKQVSLFHFPIRVLHPRRYLKTQAFFDATESQFSLSVEALSKARLPDSDIALSLSFEPSLAVGPVRTVLNRDRTKVQLTAVLPKRFDSETVLRAVLSVSDYPGAFAWRLTNIESRQEIPEDTSTMAIRLVSPKPGKSFQTPNAAIPVELHLVAPPGFPGAPGDKIEVGIDADRDREFRNEPVMNLDGTRGVRVGWEGVSEDGRISLSSSVGHLRLNVPTNEFVSQNANLLARMTDGRTVVWSLPVPITFDGAPPKVTNLSTGADEYFAVATPVTLFVKATDGQLSGIAEVQAGIIQSDPDVFSESAPKAVLTESSRGSWTGNLETATLAPGTHIVGVRAVDRVGNASKVFTQSILIVSAEEATRMAAEATNAIRGSVLYGGEPVAGATISLKRPEATEANLSPSSATESQEKPLPSIQTDQKGNFALEDVRVGNYTMVVEALVRGLKRIQTFEIEVTPAPARLRQDVELR